MRWRGRNVRREALREPAYGESRRLFGYAPITPELCCPTACPSKQQRDSPVTESFRWLTGKRAALCIYCVSTFATRVVTWVHLSSPLEKGVRFFIFSEKYHFKGEYFMLTLDMVYSASYKLKEVIRRTDLIPSNKISDKCNVFLKTENLQVCIRR